MEKFRFSPATQMLWAKKRRENGTNLWLPLVAHLTDTKNAICWLYDNWLDDQQRKILTRTLAPATARKLVAFLGAAHDIGKATPAFQFKPSYQHDKVLDDAILSQLRRVGLSSVAVGKTPHTTTGEWLLSHAGLNDTVAAIIGGHHGKPLGASFLPNDVNQADIFGKVNDASTKKSWQTVQTELLNFALQTAGFALLADIPQISQAQAAVLSGLLIMADWLASSETFANDASKPMFTLIPLSQGMADLNLDTRLKKALAKWQISDQYRAAIPADVDTIFKRHWGFAPRNVQKTIANDLASLADVGLTVIEAPMGIGKTELALAISEQLFVTQKANGIFFGLPTQATANAMFTRVEAWLSDLAHASAKHISLKLMHAKAQFNPDVQHLPYASEVSDDQDGSVVINEWFSGKLGMLNSFTVGTIDHLLLAGLKQKHLALRHLGLSGKVVIIDEVHAYDAYMMTYLTRVLNWLGAYHVPVIALSATLPEKIRQELVTAYALGAGMKKSQLKLDDWQATQAYPLVTTVANNQVKQFSQFALLDSHQVKVTQLPTLADGTDDTKLIAHVMEHIKNGGVAGIIVNTVQQAQALFRQIPDDCEKLLLHSAFLAPKRTKLEQELQAKIGKNGERPHKMVVVGTQVLEQSLDIDFDVLYSAMAPMDLLLQRVGRLQRHEIIRPQALKARQFFVFGASLTPKLTFGVNEIIYPRYLLLKTKHFLPATITLPTDISLLVQTVYSQENDDELDVSDEVAEDVAIAKKKFNAQQAKKQAEAKAYQIKEPKRKKSLHGWLDFDQNNLTIEQAQACVRDIEPTLEVILLKRGKSADYLCDEKQTLLSSVDAKTLAQQLIRLPHAVTPNYAAMVAVLQELQTKTQKHFPDWHDSIWLKNMVAVMLDENNQVILGGYKLKYDLDLGLLIKKEDENG